MANITSQNFVTYLGNRVGSRNKTYYAQGGFPSVNAYYGTYDTLLTAHKTLCAAFGDFEDFSEITKDTPCKEIPRAFTVAIEEDGSVVEYQYKKVMPEGGYTGNDLEKKTNSIVEIKIEPVDGEEFSLMERNAIYRILSTSQSGTIFVGVDNDGHKHTLNVQDSPAFYIITYIDGSTVQRLDVDKDSHKITISYVQYTQQE